MKDELKLVLGWLLLGVAVPLILGPPLAASNRSSSAVVGLVLVLSGGFAAIASAYTYRRACTLWQVRLRDLFRQQSPLRPSFFQGRFLGGVGTVLAFGFVMAVVGLLMLAMAALGQL